MDSRHCRIGFDIGGTFTDFVLLDQRTKNLHVHKALTTAPIRLQVRSWALTRWSGTAGVSFADVVDVVHGTTIVTNAVIERHGATTALLTTRGFRDIVEMGTEQRYDIHDIFLKFPEPLVPRRLRFEIDERIAKDGAVVRPIAADEVRSQLAAAVADGATTVAVCFLHAYKNDAHEQFVAAGGGGAFPRPASLAVERGLRRDPRI